MMSLPNLLIVDDTRTNLFLLEKLVKEINVNLISALSGGEALAKIKGLELALAIIDVRMPGMDGFELAMHINRARPTEKVPVIFLTANNINDTELFKGYSSGAVDYIQKPINNNILLSKIKVFLDLFNQRQLIIANASLLKEAADKLTEVNTTLKKSEEKYRSYINYAPHGVFIIDESGNNIEVNKAACTITGFREDELLTMSVRELLAEESLEEGLAHFRLVTITGTAKADLLFKQKNGSKRWWTVSAVKLSETRYLGFTEDITDRKKLEEELRSYQTELELQNEELILAKEKAENATDKYAELYDFAPTGYLTLSADRTILELNHSAANLLGKERSLLIGAHFVFFVSKENRPLLNSFFLKLMKSNVKETVEVMLETASNQSKYVHIEGRIVGNGPQCVLNIIDLTEHKFAEERLHQANSFLDSIVENIPHMIFIKDTKELRFIRINRAGEDLLGISKEEILGKNDYDFFSKEDAEKYTHKDKEVLNRREMMDIVEETIQTHEKGSRILHTKKVPILNEEGDPEYLLGISEDITERKLSENSLKVSEEKYRTMVNASPDGILLVDMNGVIMEISEIGLELLGAENKDEITSKYFYRFIPSDQRNTIKEIYERTMTEGISQNVEIKIRKKNRSIFLSEASATLIQGASGQPLSFMIIIRDISFRKKMETKQIHADRMANLGEMASGIAHEINQPLNIISMVMDRILFETSKTETIDIEFLKNKSDKIFENIIRIRNIIDHVRAFSRSHENFVSTAFDINVSIENAISMISEQLKHLGINLSLSLNRQIPSLVGNTYKFEQVIVNLLINAKDAVIEKKSKLTEYFEPSIEILTMHEGHFIIVEITDNGIGIGDDDLHYIMLPFFTTKDEGKGTGLGLSICYQIIKEMGGTIDINSDPINGTKIKLIMDIQSVK